MEHFYKSSSVGKIVLMIGILLAVPVSVLPFYPDELSYAWTFLVPSIISILIGGGLCFFVKYKEHETWQVTVKKGNFIVLFAWGFGFLAGAMPFVLSGQLTFVQAVFESVSGWTTTGLSVMDVSITPSIFLFHRSFMQYCGGLGFMMMIAMVVQGKEATRLYTAEGHPDKLMPNLKKTARVILSMYVAFLLGGTCLYMLFGMPLFDSLNHAMCALSTGGFSTKADSIGYYNSLPIELITVVLMLIGTTNFAVLLLLAKKKFRQFLRVSEVRFLAVVMAFFVPFMAYSLCSVLYLNLSEGLRLALFNAVSALSTSGFSTMAYDKWPQAAIGAMILLMLIGGGIGSTAGGIKLSRVYLMLRTSLETIKKKMSSGRSVQLQYYYRAQGKTLIDEGILKETAAFFMTYLFVFISGTLALTLVLDCTLAEAMFEFSSALGTVGLSIGLTNPATDAAPLIIEICGMILGRLEIFIVMIGIYSACRFTTGKIRHLLNKIDKINKIDK